MLGTNVSKELALRCVKRSDRGVLFNTVLFNIVFHKVRAILFTERVILALWPMLLQLLWMDTSVESLKKYNGN